MRIVDSQVHVWSVPTPRHPWFPEGSTMPDPFGWRALLREMRGAGVDGAVLVPPAWAGGDPAVALDAVAHHPDRFAVMGRIDVRDPDAGMAALARWRQTPGMLGLRLAFQRPEARKMLVDGTTDWIWPAAEAHGVPIMLFAPFQNATVAEISRAHPGLNLIVDHMGLYREKDADAARAIEALIPLADIANVHVKVTSIPFYSTEPYPYRNLHGALARLIGAFGPRRSFWGTDLTRIWTLGPYRQSVTLFTEELDFLNADDLEWIMGRGVRECLGWRV